MQSDVNSVSDVTFIISKIAGMAFMDVCLNVVFNWNSMPNPNFMPDLDTEFTSSDMIGMATTD